MSAGGQSGHVDFKFSSTLRPRGEGLVLGISPFCSHIVKLQFICVYKRKKEQLHCSCSFLNYLRLMPLAERSAVMESTTAMTSSRVRVRSIQPKKILTVIVVPSSAS